MLFRKMPLEFRREVERLGAALKGAGTGLLATMSGFVCRELALLGKRGRTAGLHRAKKRQHFLVHCLVAFQVV
jgi:hypothetical protein